MKTKLCVALALTSTISYAQTPPPEPDDINISSEVRLTTNRTSRGITDSGLRPSTSVTVNMVHASGIAGLIELATVSKDALPNSNGTMAIVGAGYRNGDPDAFHYGGGFYYELFPGANYNAPLTQDDALGGTGSKVDFDTGYAILELGYGPVDIRYEHTMTNRFRGISVGAVCAPLAATDPTAYLKCLAPGDLSSRGTGYLSVNAKHKLTPQLELSGHIGVQRVANFSAANLTDVQVSLDYTVNRWVFGLDVTRANVETPQMYANTRSDGSAYQANDTALAARISYKF
ncbi:TorF family putative porin [Rhodoferax sp. UBA5149]|uniref:TorF family putative porin n=1 Tax=Rhodoferax sp. UBA5149 TaxID=1947379 RepID=UPI0025EA6EF0|nr:TorF family putative porin [Rhodoferax sp. UBA5149]